MSIFIFEDDVMQAQSLKKLLVELCEARHIPYDFIEATSKEEELLAKIAHCTYTPIYFLDIEIKGDERKGLHVAQQIRKIDERGIIVFVTTHSELAPISYQYMVSALTFIDKGRPFQERYEAIDACMSHYEQKNQRQFVEDVLVIENRHTSLKVPFQSVQYIMTDEPHRLTLVATDQVIQFYGTLKEIEQKEARFVRCHKSYLVNPTHMQALNSKQLELVLKSGQAVPVSRRLMKTVKQTLKGAEQYVL